MYDEFCSFSIFQSQKGRNTVWNSNPFDLWMERMRIPSISPDGMVLRDSFSSQCATKAVSSDECFCKYSFTES